MSFFAELGHATAAARSQLLASPVIADCLAGRVSLTSYVAFLTEAYHHVKHTVPLLMACGSRLPERLAWLSGGIVEYVEEEYGHEQWILDDIDACGGDSAAARRRGPNLATELMVSYAYDTVQRVNPVGLFGMVFVLEGTSVAIATRAAQIIAERLALPKRAFSYLLSHGSVDVKHIADFERLVDRFDHEDDRAAVLHCARVMFKLYGDVFRSLPRPAAQEAGTKTREVA
ncbi:MAG TPA: iron-containing redox enzyme family protein [Gammaproteobacteria bacterium]